MNTKERILRTTAFKAWLRANPPELSFWIDRRGVKKTVKRFIALRSCLRVKACDARMTMPLKGRLHYWKKDKAGLRFAPAGPASCCVESVAVD